MDRLILQLLCLALLVLGVRSAGARSGAPIDPIPSTICGLDGYDLNDLQLADYWATTVTTPRSDCFIPQDYAETSVTGCKIYFSICKTIPPSICGGHTNSTTCMEVTTNDNTQHYYSIGDFRGNNEFEAAGGGTDPVGFATIRQGDEPTDKLCNGTYYETALTWECDGTKKWDHSTSTDASGFTNSISLGLDKCFLSIGFGYSGACYISPTLSPDRCQLPPYNLVPLESEDYWSATVPTSVCYGNVATSCQFYLSFCQAVPVSLATECYGAGVCQIGLDDDGNAYAYNMGQFNNNFTQFYENDQVVDGGFHMDVENGSKPDDGACNKYGIRTRVVLVCNSSVNWDNQDLSALIEVAYAEAADPCQYVILIPYAGACLPVGPIVNNPPKPSPVGWILIGIFLFVVIVYLVVGAGFQFIIKGERGLRVIPNYELWATFVMLVLEGCKFTLDIVTCFQFDGTIKNRLKRPGKSGIDYDKI